MTESFGPEYVKPAPVDCPNCPCCSEQLCERGQNSIRMCEGSTPEQCRPIVTGCPCSAETTRGTAAWRAARYRATMHATVQAVSVDAEVALRAVAVGVATPEMAEQISMLTTRRYVAFEESLPLLTPFGARYLEARGEARFRTPVEVELVDVGTRTARVIVVGWSLTQSVTVLLDQLVAETSLQPADLVGKFLEADANCRAESADDLVLTRITLAPQLPDGWSDVATTGDVEHQAPPVSEPAPVAAEEPAAPAEEPGHVDGGLSGGEA